MTPYRVLVVDDMASMRRTVQRVLTRAGHEVLSAATGEEACEIMQSEAIDVVLMDLRMPAMSGRTLFQLILAQWPDLTRRLAVISGDPEADDHADWLELYDLPVLPKPFRLEEVVRMVEHLGVRAAPPVHGTDA